MVLIVLQAGAALLIAAALYAVWRSLIGDRSGPSTGDAAPVQETRPERPARSPGLSREARLGPTADPVDAAAQARVAPLPRRELRSMPESAARPGHPDPGTAGEIVVLRPEPGAMVANEVMLLRQERDAALARGEALWELVVQLRGEVDRLRSAAEPDRSGRSHLAVVPRDP